MDAACPRVERVDLAGLAAEVHAAAGDRRRTVRAVVTRQAERPTDGEPRQLRGREPRVGVALKTLVGRTRAPAAPRGAPKFTAPPRAAHIAAGGGFISILVVSGLPERYSATARRSSLDSVIAMVIIEPFSSAQDLLGCHCRERGSRRCTRHAGVVAHGAGALIGGCARRARWPRLRGGSTPYRNRDRQQHDADKLMRVHGHPLAEKRVARVPISARAARDRPRAP